MQKAKANVQQSQQESQNDDAGREESNIKNAHFLSSLSLADLGPYLLSLPFPLCMQCAKLVIIWSALTKEGATQLKVIGPPFLQP